MYIYIYIIYIYIYIHVYPHLHCILNVACYVGHMCVSCVPMCNIATDLACSAAWPATSAPKDSPIAPSKSSVDHVEHYYGPLIRNPISPSLLSLLLLFAVMAMIMKPPTKNAAVFQVPVKKVRAHTSGPQEILWTKMFTVAGSHFAIPATEFDSPDRPTLSTRFWRVFRLQHKRNQ